MSECVWVNEWVRTLNLSHVNFQLNAISSCVIIRSSIKILASIPLFMLSLHNSFMLFALVVIQFRHSTFIALFLRLFFFIFSLFLDSPLRTLFDIIDLRGFFYCYVSVFCGVFGDWILCSCLLLSLVRLTFQLFIDSFLGCQIRWTYIVNSIFS